MAWTLNSKMMVLKKMKHHNRRKQRKERNLEFWIPIKSQHQLKCWVKYWITNRLENRSRWNGKKSERAISKENVLQNQKELESILISAFERNNLFRTKNIYDICI